MAPLLRVGARAVGVMNGKNIFNSTSLALPNITSVGNRYHRRCLHQKDPGSSGDITFRLNFPNPTNDPQITRYNTRLVVDYLDRVAMYDTIEKCVLMVGIFGLSGYLLYDYREARLRNGKSGIYMD